MEFPESAHNESVTTSRRRLYTLHSVTESEGENESGDIDEFKDQIQKKFVRSVANKIYSFPLAIEDGCSFFSDSEGEELEEVREYDLNSQNKKQRTVHWEQPLSKEKGFLKKNCIEQKGAEQKRQIREKSREAKRKYADLLKLIEKKQPTQPTMTTSIQLASKSRESIKRLPSHNHVKSKEELPHPAPRPFIAVHNELKTKPLTNKINRLRTEPDESSVSTHRVNGIIKFHNNAPQQR